MIQPTECDESTETSHSFHENIAFFFCHVRRYCRTDFFKKKQAKHCCI